MTLQPEFELGLWNGWWFTLIYWLITAGFLASFRRETIRRLTDAPEFSAGVKLVVQFEKNLYVAPMVYAAWTSIKFGTVWCYAGLPLFALGMAGYAVSLANYGSTPAGEPIVKGIYRYSRHPMYVTSFLAWMGAGLATASWLILSANLVLFALMHFTNQIEERECVRQYGDSYREYLERVPRYFWLF
jgi:protein-S-isoprenylcysteine O-methyltransferase Ste14